MPINNVNDFISSLDPPAPKGRQSNASHDWDRQVQWGPPTSLSAQDAGSRLGFNTGDEGKLGAFLDPVGRDALIKEAFLGTAVSGAVRAGKGLLGASKVLGGKVLGAGKGLGGKALQAGGKGVANVADDVVEGVAKKAPKSLGLLGMTPDAGFMGYDLWSNLQHPR